MDLVSLALLSMFAAAAVGGVLGFLVGRLSRFELGLAVGLLIFGAVALAFAARLFVEYREFAHAGANAAWGEVFAIEDVAANASSSVTSPVPLVRFTAPDKVTHVIRGPASGSAQVGSHVNVVYDPADPQRSRVGQLGELRSGAIAMLLFGTFPLSFGFWLLLASALGRDDAKPARRKRPHRAAPKAVRDRFRPEATDRRPRTEIPARPRMQLAAAAINAGLVCAILWIGLAPGELQRNFADGFSAVAVLCSLYAVWGWASKASASWSAGMLVLSVNFAVWAFALYLLL